MLSYYVNVNSVSSSTILSNSSEYENMNNNQVDDALELRQKLLRQSKHPLSGLNPTHPMDAYGTKEAAHYSLGMDVLSQLGN